VFEDMKARGQKRLDIVAMSNSYGQVFTDVAQKLAPAQGIEIVAVERFAAADTSFVSQALKLMAAQPEAILIAAAGTPAAMPPLELVKRGYKGQIYQTQAVANNDFLRVGGKDVEGTRMPVSPLLVAEQLPDSNVVKQEALRFVNAYRARYPNDQPSLFGGEAWDAYLLVDDAVRKALTQARPGTVEFRKAVRDALEQTKEKVLTQGVYTMTPQDHNGADERSQVLVEVKDGKWRYVK
jgi:branched-chain amino acid transport system substrate-binding protein